MYNKYYKKEVISYMSTKIKRMANNILTINEPTMEIKEKQVSIKQADKITNLFYKNFFKDKVINLVTGFNAATLKLGLWTPVRTRVAVAFTCEVFQKD